MFAFGLIMFLFGKFSKAPDASAAPAGPPDAK
jgi:hypothetical protein